MGIRYHSVCHARVRALQAPLSSVAAAKRRHATPRAPDRSDRHQTWQQPAAVLMIQAQMLQQAAGGDTGDCMRGWEYCSLEEATKYVHNLNNLVSEPAGTQRRSQEPSQKDEKEISQRPEGCLSILMCLPAEAMRQPALRHVSPACRRVSDEWIWGESENDRIGCFLLLRFNTSATVVQLGWFQQSEIWSKHLYHQRLEVMEYPDAPERRILAARSLWTSLFWTKNDFTVLSYAPHTFAGVSYTSLEKKTKRGQWKSVRLSRGLRPTDGSEIKNSTGCICRSKPSSAQLSAFIWQRARGGDAAWTS